MPPDDARPQVRSSEGDASERARDVEDVTGRGHRHDDKSTKPGPLKNPLVIVGVVAGVVVLLIVGTLWWLQARRWQATDDAYIDGHVVHVAPQVSGTVVRLYVTDNAVVRAGQPLVDIDAADPRARLQQANAQIAQAQAQIGQQAAIIAADQAAQKQAEADASGAAAQAQEAADDLTRYRRLQAIAPQAVSAQQLDQALASARNTAAQRDSAEKKADGAAEQVRAAQAQATGLKAQVAADQAQAQQSQITLADTRLTAPIDGHVAKFNVALGNYVQPGQELMAVVPATLWITANFKETQLALMRVGQRVDVRVDACSGAPLRAHVDSIQRGAGQAFALLPPENATGNFVKVVQRVPVKIVFDHVPESCPLGPGMSVEPKVLVRP
ncbi:MAG TPA: HlyD family secretion protein [Caulobacteraceae bacterium]|jgi:membrane fusion protein (multidrug efflux system)